VGRSRGLGCGVPYERCQALGNLSRLLIDWISPLATLGSGFVYIFKLFYKFSFLFIYLHFVSFSMFLSFLLCYFLGRRLVVGQVRLLEI
jgi:hypothetical protein